MYTSYKIKYSIMSKISIICIYRLYQQRYADRQCPNHSMFYRINKLLSMKGTFMAKKKRRNTVTTDNNSLEVLCKLIESPHISLRVVASKPKK